MKVLSKPTPKSIYWEYAEITGASDEYYLIKNTVWPYPMWTFYLLKKTALFFDKLADIPRRIIRRYGKDLLSKI